MWWGNELDNDGAISGSCLYLKSAATPIEHTFIAEHDPGADNVLRSGGDKRVRLRVR